MTAMKLLRSRVDEKRANLKSVYYVDCCVASLPAPPPPPCFAGGSPSPPIAGGGEAAPPPAGPPRFAGHAGTAGEEPLDRRSRNPATNYIFGFLPLQNLYS